MSEKSSVAKKSVGQAAKKSWRHWLLRLIGYSAWIVAAYLITVLAVGGLISALDKFDANPLSILSENIQNVIYGVIVYVLMLLIVIGVPKLILHQKTTLVELGLQRLPQWKDIAFAIGGMIVYFVLAVVSLMLLDMYTGINLDQPQDVGVTSPSGGTEMIVGFLLLVVIAPIAEEMIFRGYLYGKLKKAGVPIAVIILVVSVLFGVAHGQWNVGINVGILSVVMCLARMMTGSIWAGIMMHMMKNGLAFYVLFVTGVGQ